MKLRIFLLLLFLAPPLVHASPRISQMLIGQWHYEDAKESCTYTFRPDGTFSGEVREKPKMVWQFAGRWSISGSTIHYEYTKSSLRRVPVGSVDEDRLLEIGPDRFVIVAFDGTKRKYRRVKDRSSRDKQSGAGESRHAPASSPSPRGRE